MDPSRTGHGGASRRGWIQCPRRLWWLALSLPLAALAAAVPFLMSWLNLCGISGCSGGGYGVAYGPVVVSGLLNALVGAFFGLAVGLVPWGRPRPRVVAGATVAVAFLVVITGLQLLDKYAHA